MYSICFHLHFLHTRPEHLSPTSSKVSEGNESRMVQDLPSHIKAIKIYVFQPSQTSFSCISPSFMPQSLSRHT